MFAFLILLVFLVFNFFLTFIVKFSLISMIMNDLHWKANLNLCCIGMASRILEGIQDAITSNCLRSCRFSLMRIDDYGIFRPIVCILFSILKVLPFICSWLGLILCFFLFIWIKTILTYLFTPLFPTKDSDNDVILFVYIS